jgi:hypothetical protein
MPVGHYIDQLSFRSGVVWCRYFGMRQVSRLPLFLSKPDAAADSSGISPGSLSGVSKHQLRRTQLIVEALL